MIEVSKLSSKYKVRALNDSDADSILKICLDNPLFYKFSETKATKEQILKDLHITPPKKDISDKYYVGFYQNETLIAVMDLIDGFPKEDIGFIGFFMMKKAFQGKDIGTSLISEVSDYLKFIGKKSIRLCINKDNPQSNHFWKKNGFIIIDEIIRNGFPIVIAEKKLF